MVPACDRAYVPTYCTLFLGGQLGGRFGWRGDILSPHIVRSRVDRRRDTLLAAIWVRKLTRPPTFRRSVPIPDPTVLESRPTISWDLLRGAPPGSWVEGSPRRANKNEVRIEHKINVGPTLVVLLQGLLAVLFSHLAAVLVEPSPVILLCKSVLSPVSGCTRV
jgi:hypothetical protein